MRYDVWLKAEVEKIKKKAIRTCDFCGAKKSYDEHCKNCYSKNRGTKD